MKARFGTLTSAACAFLSVYSACLSAAPESKLQWRADGTVIRGQQRIQTVLKSVSAALDFPPGIYLGGYKIDAQGINYPYVVFVPASLQDPSEWPFDDSVQEFFIVNDVVHVLLYEGKSFQRTDSGWDETTFRFKSDSTIVSTDDVVIACNPSPLAMTSQEKGSCYAVDGGWSIDLNWRELKPRVCSEGALTVVERRGKALIAHRIGLMDGRVQASKPLEEFPSDICSISM